MLLSGNLASEKWYFTDIIRLGLIPPDKEGHLQVLTLIDHGVVALVDHTHTRHVGHGVRGDVGARDLRVPDLKLLHLTGQADVEVPLLCGSGQPGLVQIQLSNISLM